MHRLGTSERPDLRVAVVVGAGALGMAMARRMAQRFRILLVDVDGTRAEAEAGLMRAEGCDATPIACDITSPADVAKLAEAVKERGGLGALVQVAGLSPSNASFTAIMRVNLMGAAMVAEALLPLALPGAAAILIASLASHLSTPSQEAQAVLRNASAHDLAERLGKVLGDQATPAMAYTHSKYGLLMYARMQAPAWGARGARIVSLSPGMIATPMGALEFEKNEAKRRMFEHTPLERECTMLEIADAAEFLASDRASFITGTDLLVDGGLAAAMSVRPD